MQPSTSVDEDDADADVCRVCRSEASPSQPLFHPCMCMGSIKYIHQECLVRWLKYSERTTCELCNHRFRFSPIYAPETPRFVPVPVLLRGVARSCVRVLLSSIQQALVVLAWFIVVPLTACRIYRCLLSGGIQSLLTLPLDMLSTRNLIQDCIQGSTLILLGFAAFMGYSSLHERFLQGGGPDWLVWPTPVDSDEVENEGPFIDDGNNAEQPPNLEIEPQQVEWRFANDPQDDHQDAPEQAADGADDDDDEDGPNAAAGAGFDNDQFNLLHVFGLDGTFAFLEHVLWFIALVTLIIFLFTFCPYQLGRFAVYSLKIDTWIEATRMEGVSTSILGYIVIAFLLVTLNLLFSRFDHPRGSYYAGLFYIYIKVSLVALFELGICPILCGFWIDACTLNMFNATVADRLAVFDQAPIAIAFMHWAVGLFFIFYLSSLLMVARSIVRPGLLDFVRLFINVDHKPIQDMIVQPLHIYLQRIIATFSLWGILVVLLLWLPVELVRRLLPSVFPFQISEAYESPIEYSVEIILVQIVMPFLIDHYGKACMRQVLRGWCVLVSSALGLRSFLLGDENINTGEPVILEDGSVGQFAARPSSTSSNADTTTATTDQSSIVSIEGEDVHVDQDGGPPPGPANEERYQEEEDVNIDGDADEEEEEDDQDGERRRKYVPYKLPANCFHARVGLLLVTALLSSVSTTGLMIIAPVSIGRLFFRLLTSHTLTPKHDALAVITGFFLISVAVRLTAFLPSLFLACSELLSTAMTHCRNFVTWFHMFASQLRPAWFTLGCEGRRNRGRRPRISPQAALLAPGHQQSVGSIGDLVLSVVWQILDALMRLVNVSSTIGVLFIGLPIGLGLLINLTLIAPIRVPLAKSIYFGFWENWIIGIMHVKLCILLSSLGPQWWLQDRINTIRDELVNRRFDLSAAFIIGQAEPILVGVTLGLCFPYVVARHCGSFLLGIESSVPLQFAYPVVFSAVLLASLVIYACVELASLYNTIKDEEYVVGHQLINFQPAKKDQKSDGRLELFAPPGPPAISAASLDDA